MKVKTRVPDMKRKEIVPCRDCDAVYIHFLGGDREISTEEINGTQVCSEDKQPAYLDPLTVLLQIMLLGVQLEIGALQYPQCHVLFGAIYTVHVLCMYAN